MFDDRFQQMAALADLLTDAQLKRQFPRPILNLPNLVVVGTGYFFTFLPTPSGIEISTRIANTGPRDSGPFTVMTNITLNGQMEPLIYDRINNLPAHTSQKLVLTEITEIPEATALSICVTIWLDPPTINQPWGEVFESNELDNYVGPECVLIPPSKPYVPRPEDFE